VTIAEQVAERGFVPVGRAVLEKDPAGKRFAGAEGYFHRVYEPTESVRYRPYGQSEPPRLKLDE
jgi:hypothetical protein